MGRPPKPEDEKYIKRMLTFPPALWRRVEEQVPKGEQAAFVRRAVEAALDKSTGTGPGALP